jgi:hypothetical protein
MASNIASNLRKHFTAKEQRRGLTGFTSFPIAQKQLADRTEKQSFKGSVTG